MPRFRDTVEQILAKLREAEVALSKGTPSRRPAGRWASRNSYVMNCWIASCLIRSGRRRCSWNAGGRPTTRFDRTVR